LNYLSEILAFYDWLAANPLPSSAIVLWHALMSVANGSKWSREITPAMSTLESKTGLGKDAVIEARNRLRQIGLIDWKSRKGNQSAVYILNPFVSVQPTQSPTQLPTQYPAQSTPQHPAQVPAIYKRKETKRNECIPRTRGRETSYDLEEIDKMLDRITF
jgi:hypothetical protein